MANYKILSDAEIRAALAELPDWTLKAPNIEARFELKTFRDAIAFIVEVAIQAEVMNHHPEFHNSYNILSFSFCTHDAGMKITDLDIETAQAHQRARAPLPSDALTFPAPREFEGKVAVVTGGGAGIGYAIARAFAREGARVAIAGRTEATLTHAAETIEKECGRPVLAVPADVAEAADCERLIATTVDKLGAVDILVNNAALFAVLPLIDADAAGGGPVFRRQRHWASQCGAGVRALGDRSQTRRRHRQRQQHRRRTACAGPWALFRDQGGARQLDPNHGGRVGWTWAAGQCGRAGPCRDRRRASGLKDRTAGREGGAGAHPRRPHRRWRRHC